MDGSVNFNQSGYTTPESSFNNMQIDTAGNYYVPKADMKFGFYDTMTVREGIGAGPTSDYDTAINFQPYAISDGKGWCGSTMVTNPNGLDAMAGQISFDFAFDAYLFDQVPGVGLPAPQLVPGFVMRSYGDYTMDVHQTLADVQMNYEGHAVGNNTDPMTVVAGQGGTVDPAFQNKVSFLGGGVIPNGVWVSADSFDAPGLPSWHPDGTWDVTIVPEGTPGAVYHSNDFAGYAFLLRADANRTLEWISPEGHSDYVATDPAAYASLVPVPAAVWLFGSGLVGLFGIAAKRKAA
ncbi:MAG: VPLPA-CTERM sorting domain-containing protein [Deltaproteobacteria bacterium]|nr:VPLPA-CTERM sorting domain-containing protein [Deltaproteobacteria bacterium]